VLVWKKGDFMTREQAKQVLIGMGIEEPSDEQVSKYLDSVTGEVKKEKDKNASLQEKANKAADLEKELEELKQQNMTDAEKAELERQKEKAANEKRISDLESALATSQREALTGKITSIFANAGMQGDAYAGAIKAFSNMNKEDALKEAQTFVDGISEVNKTTLDTAKAAWEKEILENTPNPGGGAGDSNETKKSDASEYAKAYSARMNQEAKAADDNAPVNI
jgi:predicted RNase H-like nuclease (RuvC/YqgF family)